MPQNVIILGAAGRDFHDFNIFYRNNPNYSVVAFTAAQIEGIEERSYPPELAGSQYPEGIPIYPEKELALLIKRYKVDRVHFAYSDISYDTLMHKASIASSHGASFFLAAATDTMLKSTKPVIAVCAVRTGCGKSQTTRKVCEIMLHLGKKTVVVRHPMPYGDLKTQTLQRFASYKDLDEGKCSIEEREEYEPLIEKGIVVFAGVDYEKILEAAQKESDIIIWDGGNNDTPFFKPDIHITILDPHRAGHERHYYPGETNLRMADIAIIGKIDSAQPEQIKIIQENIAHLAPNANLLLAMSQILVQNFDQISGKRVLVVEEGPTITHGEMGYGAGYIAAKRYHAAKIIDPRPFATEGMTQVYNRYAHIGSVLPAVGYNKDQIKDLEETINKSECDLVLYATPINLEKLITINKPALRVRYEYADVEPLVLEALLISKLTP